MNRRDAEKLFNHGWRLGYIAGVQDGMKPKKPRQFYSYEAVANAKHVFEKLMWLRRYSFRAWIKWLRHQTPLEAK